MCRSGSTLILTMPKGIVKSDIIKTKQKEEAHRLSKCEVRDSRLTARKKDYTIQKLGFPDRSYYFYTRLKIIGYLYHKIEIQKLSKWVLHSSCIQLTGRPWGFENCSFQPCYSCRSRELFLSFPFLCIVKPHSFKMHGWKIIYFSQLIQR